MNRPLTEAEWEAIKAQIREIARQHNLEIVAYPPRKQPSLPHRDQQEQERKAS